jgi:hypothetical protein
MIGNCVRKRGVTIEKGTSSYLVEMPFIENVFL